MEKEVSGRTWLLAAGHVRKHCRQQPCVSRTCFRLAHDELQSEQCKATSSSPCNISKNCATAGMTIELNPTKAHLVVPILPGADGRRIAAIGDRVIVHKLDVAA